MRRSKYGVERALLENHSRWLVSEETAIILQGPIETLYLPFALLQESGEIPPPIFVLHPRRESIDGEDWGLEGMPLNPAQLQDNAQCLAAEHQVYPKTLRDAKLLKRLDQGLRRFRQACLDLTEADRLQQSVPPTSEWLLDNEYIFESNTRDVRLNLPWRFYQAVTGVSKRARQGASTHLRTGAGTRFSHRSAPGAGKHPGLYPGLSIGKSTFDR